MSDVREIRRLKFERRPSPVLAEHRPLYKIGQLLLVFLMASTQQKSSLPRLQLFNWAMKSHIRQSLLIDAAKNKRLDIAAWGFDPALAVALQIGISEGLIRENSTGYELADKGKTFIESAMLDDENYLKEREFLSAVGKKISEKMVEETTKGWEQK